MAIAGLAVVIAVAVVLTVDARRVGLDAAFITSGRIASVAAHSVIEPRLATAQPATEPANIAGLDAVIRKFVLEGPLVRVKLMTGRGRIIYSDEPRLIGDTYPLDAEQESALSDRQARGSVSNPHSAEDRFEQTPLLEVYVGMRGSTGEPLLLETYFRPDDARILTSRVWQQLVVPALGGLVLLQLMNVPVVWSRSQRLRRERQRLLSQVAQSSTLERRRIAGELHDGVVPELTGLCYMLDTTSRGSPHPSELRGAMVDAADRLRGTVEALRSLLVDLYPPDVAGLGLPTALAELASVTALSGSRVRLSVDELLGLPMPAAAILFRSAQEALRNVAAHSQAKHITVVGRRTGTTATLMVEDDGQGFDPSATSTLRRRGHLGLRLLDDLVSGAGGRLVVRSTPGLGTTVEVEVPVT